MAEKLRPREAFHQHLDVCKQCREHPFDLCPLGGMLLEHAGRDTSPAPEGT